MITQSYPLQFKYPPNIDECIQHRMANIIFKQVDKSLLRKYCPCCGRIVGSQPNRTIFYDPLQLSYLGTSLPLYFTFAKSILVLLLMYMGIFGIYSVITDVQGSNCVSNCGTKTYTNESSIFNIFNDTTILLIQKYLLLALMVVTIVGLIILRWFQDAMHIHIDNFLATPSDFSLMVRNIPNEAKEKDVEEMVDEMRGFLSPQHKQQTNNLEIVKIMMVYDATKFLKQKQKKLTQFKKLIKEEGQVPQMKIQNISHRFANTAIITFSHSSAKQFFLQPSNGCEKLIRYCWGSYYPKSSIHRVLDRYVSLTRAPQPQQIIWQNCGKSTVKLFMIRICLYVVSVLVLLVGGALQLLIAYVRSQYVDEDDIPQQLLYSSLSAILITIFNFLIITILHITANNEYYDNKSQLKVALIVRIVLFQFLNTGIFVIVVNVVIQLLREGRFQYAKSFITFDIMQIMVLNALTTNVINLLINRFQIVKRVFRYLLSKNILTYTQEQANELYEPPPVEIQYKYSYIFKTFWLTAFFLPTVPYVIVVAFVGLLMNFWIEKYLFSGCYKAPQAFSSFLNNQVINLLDYTLLWLSLGSFVIHAMKENFQVQNIDRTIIIIHIVFGCLSVVNVLIPYRFIIKRCVKQQLPTELESYHKVKEMFEVDYEDTNPLYLHVHRQEKYKQKLKHYVESQEFINKLGQYF